jgi:hypothetical protein
MPAMRWFQEPLLPPVLALTLALACDDGAPPPGPKDGSTTLQINGLIDHCPDIQSMGVSPSVVRVGAPALVTVMASDPDADDVLTYTWTTGNGAFANPTRSATSYSCAAAGMPSLSVKVSDGQCDSRASIAVTCEPADDVP